MEAVGTYELFEFNHRVDSIPKALALVISSPHHNETLNRILCLLTPPRQIELLQVMSDSVYEEHSLILAAITGKSRPSSPETKETLSRLAQLLPQLEAALKSWHKPHITLHLPGNDITAALMTYLLFESKCAWSEFPTSLTHKLTPEGQIQFYQAVIQSITQEQLISPS